jgi:hypothetical protein
MEEINVGSIANDGTGDDLLSAFIKVKNNFNYVENHINSVINTVAENIGTGTGIYFNKVDNSLQFKSITGLNGIKIANTNNTIEIYNDFTNISITGVNSITSTGTISADGGFVGELTGDVEGNVLGTVYAATGPVAVFGDIVGPRGLITNIGDPLYYPAHVDGIAIQDFYRHSTTFDFGNIKNQTFTSPLAYLITQIGVDMGTITNPATFNIDVGALV